MSKKVLSGLVVAVVIALLTSTSSSATDADFILNAADPYTTIVAVGKDFSPDPNDPSGNTFEGKDIVNGTTIDFKQPGSTANDIQARLHPAHTQADVVAISSIKDIVNGTTIDFEQPGSTANDILPIFDMTATPNVGITTLTFPVTGNSDAPISNRALFGVLRIQTTGKPWNQIGLTGIGTQLGVSRTLTLSAFDISNIELGSVTRVFAPVDSSFAAYNAAAVFLGLSSTTPIHAIELTSDNPNTAWDNLRFSVALIPVPIDIKPGSDPNSINCNIADKVIPVAILTTEDFDATTVDHTTVTLEGARETHVDRKSGEPRRHEEDVDYDGDTDLVFHFRLGDTDLTCESTEGTLAGETFEGLDIEGSDAVRMVDRGGG